LNLFSSEFPSSARAVRADGALVPGAVGETRPLAMRLRSLEGATLLVEVS